MDTSEVYRKMSNRPVIQGQRTEEFWRRGDCSFLSIRGESFFYIASDNDSDSHVPGEIWLPRIEDWVEMLKPLGTFDLIWDGYEFSVALVENEALDPEKYLRGDTAEQALCQVWMHTQGFEWIEEKWQKNKNS